MVLETNIYATPTTAAAELALAQRESSPFQFLLETVRPKIIVAHGRDSAAVVDRTGTTSMVVNERHFSRGWSGEAAEDLGRRLAGLLGSVPSNSHGCPRAARGN